MQKVQLDKHVGMHSNELNYFNFYGLYFDTILQAANFLKHIKYNSEITYEGFCHKKVKCLKEVSTGMIYLDNGGFLPDETFLDDYIKKYGKTR